MGTKSVLLAQIGNAKNNFILGLSSIWLLADQQAIQLLQTTNAVVGSFRIPLNQVIPLLRNSQDRDIALKEFAKMLLRALTRESFELLKDYCASSSQKSKLESQSWYHFARLIRNTLAHDFKFKFNERDKREVLPVTWRGKTITANMDGTNLKLRFFGYADALELMKDFEDFINNQL